MSARRLAKQEKREAERQAKIEAACKTDKVVKQDLIVIVKVFLNVVNITGILESSNQVVVQKQISKHPTKMSKFFRNLQKKYNLKLYHAQDVPSLDGLEPFLKGQGFKEVNSTAAGIDIGSKEHWVCVPAEKDKENVRKFSTYTNDLYAIAQWLKDCGVTTVAIESTGVYWIPIFQILEEKGFQVCLVNTKHMKRVPGRTKTDRIDCLWIQKLHSFGLLAASFRPDEKICQIRSLARHRRNLIEANNQHIQHMQKSLEQMNIKLTVAISDICGASGLRIIQAILQGDRDFEKLADLADPKVKASRQEIIEALHGDYRKEHLFALKQSLDFFRFTLQKIEECDREIENLWQNMTREQQTSQMTFDFANHDSHMPKNKKDRNDLPYQASAYFRQITGVDVTKIPGIKDNSAQTIFSEVGFDMHRWPDEHHFVSWLGFCPNREASGGKVKSDKSRKVKNRAAAAFRQSASTLKSSKSYLGAFYRRIKARRGAAKALTATARKLAIIFYKMLKFGTEFIELGPDHYLQQNQERMLRKLKRNANLLGYKLVAKNA